MFHFVDIEAAIKAARAHCRYSGEPMRLWHRKPCEFRPAVFIVATVAVEPLADSLLAEFSFNGSEAVTSWK